jgi:hypothetical protein
MTNTTPAIYASMSQCITDIGMLGITKSGTNSFQKFNYRSIDSVLAAFNKVFAKNQIFMIQQTVDTSREIVGQDTKGVNIWKISFDLQVFFYSGIDGSSLPQPSIISGINDGKDSSKLTGQLTSYLLKELLFKQFLVPTEGADDLDSRDSSGIPTKVVEGLEANKKGIRWVEPPNDAAQAITWAANMLGQTEAEAKALLDGVQPDESGKKFIPFVKLVKTDWKKS